MTSQPPLIALRQMSQLQIALAQNNKECPVADLRMGGGAPPPSTGVRYLFCSLMAFKLTTAQTPKTATFCKGAPKKTREFSPYLD